MSKGVLLPSTGKDARSSTVFNKAMVKDMAEALGDAALAKAVTDEADWRHKYDRHLDCLTEGLVRADKVKLEAALRAGMARGCAMDFEGPDGVVPLESALVSLRSPFQTVRVQGTGTAKFELKLPYAGKELSGPELDAQCTSWATFGCMEPDCAESIKAGAKRLADLCGRTFLVMGAGSELGPVRPLLEAGATVAAVATRRPKRWADLIAFARTTAGTLLVPVPHDKQVANDEELAQAAGADLLVDAPAVVEWLQRCGREAPGLVTVGTYLYADGEANLRLTAASDFAIHALAKLGRHKVSFAWLSSCSTSIICPQQAVDAQETNLPKATWWQRLVGSPQQCGRVGDVRVYHGLEVMQGPNYALSQSLRQWRAVLLHMEGFTVSTPVTPMCRTESVCHNATMATILDGVGHVTPLEAFQPEACRMAMFAVLISDLTDPTPQLLTPMHLLSRKAFHSGLWRCPFVMSSLGKTIWVLGKIAAKQSPLH